MTALPKLATKPTTSPTVRDPFTDFPGTSDEHRSFDFFFSQKSYVASFFDTEFWRFNLRQMGTSQKPVQHLLIAVAARHEDLLTNKDEHALTTRTFTMKQVNKAIRSLHIDSEDKTSRQVALLMCQLFLWLDSMVGLRENVWAHLCSGFRVLDSYRQDFLTPTLKRLESG